VPREGHRAPGALGRRPQSDRSTSRRSGAMDRYSQRLVSLGFGKFALEAPGVPGPVFITQGPSAQVKHP
jgi:hypothetical protein